MMSLNRTIRITLLAAAITFAPAMASREAGGIAKGLDPARPDGPGAGAFERPAAYSPGKAAFSVRFQEETSAYRVIGVYVLPGESVGIEVLDAGSRDSYTLQNSAGLLSRESDRRWNWVAPSEHGLYPVVVSNDSSGETITMNIFVMIPYSRLSGECIEGYRIGSYPDKPYKNRSIYETPKGFIEVTRENKDTLVSPHFRLSQFLCKQQSDYPKYLILKERLLIKLELILEEVNRQGHEAGTFSILSGYRTPHYNRAIGNVDYSLHLWGGAADIFIDEDPRDGVMDDLNGDGKFNRLDAAVLYRLIDCKICREDLSGGLGNYGATQSHGAFVHVDVRGTPARWGKLE
ncbi:MAG: hypothetical protein JXR72_08620 [Proteobacteria bacterium]|nr:hypothetical protein [Pseudomonadota bacterium]